MRLRLRGGALLFHHAGFSSSSASIKFSLLLHVGGFVLGERHLNLPPALEMRVVVLQRSLCTSAACFAMAWANSRD